MIYPATYDITILQNATWRTTLRATEQRQSLDSITVSGGAALFIADCHKLEADEAVIFTTAAGSSNTFVPCDLAINSVYYVLASGLTPDQFRVSTTVSGSALVLDRAASGVFFVAQPVDLTGYLVDADINTISGSTQVATFSWAGIDLPNGLFELSMAPSVSSGLQVGDYSYDVSLTTASGERYYWLTGTATVQRTYSRN